MGVEQFSSGITFEDRKLLQRGAKDYKNYFIKPSGSVFVESTEDLFVINGRGMLYNCLVKAGASGYPSMAFYFELFIDGQKYSTFPWYINTGQKICGVATPQFVLMNQTDFSRMIYFKDTSDLYQACAPADNVTSTGGALITIENGIYFDQECRLQVSTLNGVTRNLYYNATYGVLP